MDERYPEIGHRRRFLESLYGRMVTGRIESLLIDRPELQRIGSDLGLEASQSVMLLKNLVNEGYLRTYIHQNGRPYMESQGEFKGVYIEGISDKGLRLIGVLPAMDSVEGVVASLEELAEQIRESQILSPDEKEQQIRALRTLMGDLRQAGVGIGAQALLQYLARGLVT